jgi:hypothetical protein
MPDTRHDTLEQRIRAHAHRLWEEEGRPDGRAEAHWFAARQLVETEVAPAPQKAERRARAKKNPN